MTSDKPKPWPPRTPRESRCDGAVRRLAQPPMLNDDNVQVEL
jgi:hypothetical protein